MYVLVWGAPDTANYLYSSTSTQERDKIARAGDVLGVHADGEHPGVRVVETSWDSPVRAPLYIIDVPDIVDPTPHRKALMAEVVEKVNDQLGTKFAYRGFRVFTLDLSNVNFGVDRRVKLSAQRFQNIVKLRFINRTGSTLYNSNDRTTPL